MMIRRERYMAPGDPGKDTWRHTGRKPGEPVVTPEKEQS
jgi:hypothetical protein